MQAALLSHVLTFLHSLLLPVELVQGGFLEHLLHEELRSEPRLVYVQRVLILKRAILVHTIVHTQQTTPPLSHLAVITRVCA